MNGGDVLHVGITTYRDTRDPIPRSRMVPYPEFVALLAPDRPPVHDRLRWRIDRDEALLNELFAAALAGRHGRDHHWRRELDKAAIRARAAGLDPQGIEAAVHEKAESLRGGIRKRAKGFLACWAGALNHPDTTRRAENVDVVTCAVLDFDDGTTIDEAVAPWEPWPLLVHTTLSHQPDHPRFRLVLVLDEPVPGAVWPRAWRWLWEQTGGRADKACKDPSRMYLLPAALTPDAPWERRVHDPGGRLLRIDWEDLTELPQEKAPRPAARGVRPAPGRSEVKADRVRRRARRLLRTDRDTRERAAGWVGARLVSNRAEGIGCPSCDRPSVWFWLDPGRQSTACCDHRNSCGWWGHLDQLLDLHGGGDVG